MKCPHCTTAIHEKWGGGQLASETEPDALWTYGWMNCPECKHMIIQLWRHRRGEGVPDVEQIVWPRGATRPLPEEVDERYAVDFAEAVAVAPISPKASAALSRRMLQDIIREKAGVTRKTLDAEIQAVIDSGTVPSWLADNLDAVRVAGNFAAHPIKSTNTGEVVEVEPGEAQFLLDVLEEAFDFWFVAPAKAARQRAALDAKLQEAGKPALKQSSS